MKDVTRCLKCKKSFKGKLIPKKDREFFGGRKFFNHEIALYDIYLDRTYAFKCPFCLNVRKR